MPPRPCSYMFQINPRKVTTRKYKTKYTAEALLNAYNEVKKTKLPVERVAAKYGIPPQTLRDRVKGLIDPKDCAAGRDTLFTADEELILVEHAEVMSQMGYGYTNIQLQHLAGDLAYDFGRRKTNKPLTNSWLYSFLGRWSQRLASRNPQRLESNRAKHSTPEVLVTYYNNLEKVLDDYDLKDKPQFIYNLDETGLQPEHRPPNIIGSVNSKAQAVTSPRSTTVTVIGCCNAIGNSIPPFFIFKGKRFMPELMNGASAGAHGTVSDSGWSNSVIFQQYLQEHFLPIINKNPEQHILLLYDGHTSHISTTLIEWAKNHKIILFVLPPHTSHLLQPLDVGVFGPFKRYYHSECSLFMKKHIGRVITRYDMCGLAGQAYLKAMSPSNIQSAFKKTGIVPFSRDTVSEDQLYPAEAFREHEPVQKVMALKGGKDDVAKFLMKKIENMQSERKSKESSICDNPKQSENNDGHTQTVVVNKAPKRPSPGGQAITEEPFEKQLRTYESSKQIDNQNKHGKTPVTKKKLFKPKTVKSTNNKSACLLSPKPSTSGLNKNNPHSVSDSEISTDEDEIPEKDLCCMCKKLSPPNLSKLPYLKIISWGCCDACGHWTHLIFCSEVRVVRRHSEFLCPHCTH